jgi:predicted small integral membrane protein
VLRPGLVFAAFAAAFWWALITFVPTSIHVELLSALFVPLGGIGLWRWGPGSLRNLWAKMLTPAKILTIAVSTMVLGLTFAGIWRLVYRWLGRPEDMGNNPWVSFPVYIGVISLILYLLATRRETDPPMPQLMWVVGIGALLVLATGYAIRVLGLGTPL